MLCSREATKTIANFPVCDHHHELYLQQLREGRTDIVNQLISIHYFPR